MLESERGEQSPARRALQKTFLDQEWLDDVFNRVTRFRQGGSKRIDTDRASSVTRGNRREVAAVHRIEPSRINFKRQQRAVGDFPVDGLGAVDMGEVAHTAQKPSGDARGAARAARDFIGAVGRDADAQYTRATIDDLFEFFFGVEIRAAPGCRSGRAMDWSTVQHAWSHRPK